MAYLIAAIVMTLRFFEGHSAVASHFKWDISYLWTSASAELLLKIGFHFSCNQGEVIFILDIDMTQNDTTTAAVKRFLMLDAMLACVRLSVRPLDHANRDSGFPVPKMLAKFEKCHPKGRTKCKWGRLYLTTFNEAHYNSRRIVSIQFE